MWTPENNSELTSQMDIRVNLACDVVFSEVYVMWYLRAKNLSKLTADMVANEIPQNVTLKIFVNCCRKWKGLSSLAIKSGWTIKPTTRSEAARPHSKIMEGERSEGVFMTAANTKEFPKIEISISGKLRKQFTMTIVEGIVEFSLLSTSWSYAGPLEVLKTLFCISEGFLSERYFKVFFRSLSIADSAYNFSFIWNFLRFCL